MAFQWATTDLPAIPDGGWVRASRRGAYVMNDVIPVDGASSKEGITYPAPYNTKRDKAVCLENGETVYDALLTDCDNKTERTLTLPNGDTYTAVIEEVSEASVMNYGSTFFYRYTVTFVEA